MSPPKKEAEMFKRHNKIYDTNPLIASMSTLLESPPDVQQSIEFLPPIPTEEDRATPIRRRLSNVGQIPRLHVALARDLELSIILAEVIREGYVDRAPNAKYWEEHVPAMERFIDAIKKSSGAISADRCLALLGISGIGKTRIIEKLLSLVPQVIIHDRAKDPNKPLKQVVWIKVECPHNRSPGSIARKIIEQIGLAVDENYTQQFSTGNNDDLITNAGTLARQHCMGLIVIDEIQNVIANREDPKRDLVNLLVELSNELKIPVLFAGTLKASKKIGREMRSARRITGPTWNNFTADDEDWGKLVKTIWEYQWNADYTPLDDNLLATIYDLTQGVPAFFIRLFHFAQRRAILLGPESPDGRERITAELLNEVFELNFEPVKPIIHALRTKDRRLIELFEDLPQDFSLESMLVNEASRVGEEQSEKLRRSIVSARRRAACDARKRIALDATLATASMDTGGTAPIDQIVRKALAENRDPLQALAAAGLISKGLLRKTDVG